MPFYSWSQDVLISHTHARERCGCSGCMSPPLLPTPHRPPWWWGSPHGYTGTPWGVGPSALHPHGHSIWVLSASPSPVPWGGCLGRGCGAVGPPRFSLMLCSHPKHSLLWYMYFMLLLYSFSSWLLCFKSVCATPWLWFNPAVIFLFSMMPSIQLGF